LVAPIPGLPYLTLAIGELNYFFFVKIMTTINDTIPHTPLTTEMIIVDKWVDGKFAKQSGHLWREFGREQTTLEQWIS